MGREIDLAIMAKDNYSDALKKMMGTQSSFRKDLGQLNTELNKLNSNKINLKVDFTKAKNELKSAEKDFKSLDNEMSRSKLIAAQTNYDGIKRNLDLVGKSARDTEKDMRNLTSTISKADNRVQTTGNGGNGTLATLGKAGLGALLGQSAGNFGGVMAGSMFGDTAGGAISSILGGAASGAAMGSLGGPLAAGIGAAVGTAAGALNAAGQVMQKQDDAFKGVVQDQYNTLKQNETNTLKSGSETAAKRETSKISFTTMLGSGDKADSFLKDIVGFASKTPFQYEELTAMSKTLLAYQYKQDEIIPLLTKVGDTGAALDMGGDDMNIVATMFGRMKSTNKASLEYLNPLLERGIPVWQYLEKATGKKDTQLQEMVSKGLIKGGEAAKIIANAMGEANKNAMEMQSQTFPGLTSTLEDAKTELNAAMGKGYNEELKKGLQADIDFYNGADGEKMKKGYENIGIWKASEENAYKEAVRTAQSNVMNTTDYLTGDAATQGKLLQEATSNAMNEYKKSDGYQLMLSTELSLVDSLQKDLSSGWENYGYTMGKQFEKGRLAATGNGGVDGTPTSGMWNVGFGVGAPKKPFGKAFGMPYVPYDNFPALLHQGESVRTASQTRSEGVSNVNINMNGLTIREESDIDKVASAIVDKIEFARLGGVSR